MALVLLLFVTAEAARLCSKIAPMCSTHVRLIPKWQYHAKIWMPVRAKRIRRVSAPHLQSVAVVVAAVVTAVVLVLVLVLVYQPLRTDKVVRVAVALALAVAAVMAVVVAVAVAVAVAR